MDAHRTQYQSHAVETASPAQLVLMLYDGALGATARAQGSLDTPQPDLELAHRELLRAQAILTELLVTLDYERGGPVAANLASIYDFCLDRLLDANLKKDGSLLEAVTDALHGLRDAWEESCCVLAATA